MNGSDELDALKKEMVQLRNELHPLCDPGLPELPAVLMDLSKDVRDAMTRWGDPTRNDQGVDPAMLDFFDQTFQQSIEGSTERIRTRLDLMRRAKKFGEEALFKSPYGTTEAIFPIRVRGTIVHCLWTGPMKRDAISQQDIDTIARLTGLNASKISEQTDHIHPRSDTGIEQVLSFYRTLQTCFESILSTTGSPTATPDDLIGTAKLQDQAFSVLATGFAQHFNGLLSIILGYATYILNHESLSEETSEVLGKIAEAAQRGRRLTDELLAFSGKENEQVTICKMHEVFNSVISLLEAQRRHRVHFVLKMRAENDCVLAMPGEIQQIVYNMLSCAMDSLQETGGEISIRTINFDKEEEDGTSKPHIRIDVSDSGALATYSGCEPLLDAIVEQEIHEEEISLSNLHNTVQNLEGSLSVSTDASGVTHIEILLPVASADQRPDPSVTTPSAAQRLVSSNIWLIDDDPTFLHMCAEVLRQDGHHVEGFTDGVKMQDAWSKADQKPDLMVFDFSMPEYNGLELREWLVEVGASIPVVLVSGLSSSTPEIKKALAMKKTYFLQKPFANSELADIASVAMGETLLGE